MRVIGSKDVYTQIQLELVWRNQDKIVAEIQMMNDFGYHQVYGRYPNGDMIKEGVVHFDLKQK